jgi:hypothetical protein
MECYLPLKVAHSADPPSVLGHPGTQRIALIAPPDPSPRPPRELLLCCFFRHCGSVERSTSNFVNLERNSSRESNAKDSDCVIANK